MLVREPTREFRDWTSDSRKWAGFKPRPGDIVVATSPKCGTTWTQRIVGMLLRQSAALFPVQEEQPWIDFRFSPIDEILPRLEAQPGRRSLKTHSPLDALPFYGDMLYINVMRDARDACMSFHNHTTNYSPMTRAMLDSIGMNDETIGAPWPVPPSEPRDFFRSFMRVPEFAPYHEFTIDQYCDLAQSYWSARHLPNVLLIHYNDLKADLEGEMRRIADFCGIETPGSLWPELVEAAGFTAMKRDAEKLLPMASLAWDGGADRFMHKGTNQRWREVVTPEDSLLYEAAASKGMSGSLKAWSEGGRVMVGDPIDLPD